MFLNLSPKEVEIKAETKKKKWDLVKFKSFCKAKKTINKTKSLLNGRKYLQMI